MKQLTWLSLIICTTADFSVQGQVVNRSNTGIYLRRYVANVYLVGQRAIATGVLFDMTDSTLTLTDIKSLKPELLDQQGGMSPPTNSLLSALPLRVYQYADISRLTVRRRGHRGIGFLLGAGLGITLGLSADDVGYTTPTQNVLLVTVVCAFPGLLISSALSSKSIHAKKQSVTIKTPARFRTFTIVDQLRQANLYTP